MKLLADENIPQDVIRLLRKTGFDVLDIKTTSLAGKSDALILELAAKEKRIIITHDRQFISPERPPNQPITVIVVRPGNQPPPNTAEKVQAVLRGGLIPKPRDKAVKVTIEGKLMRVQILAIKPP